MSHSVMQRACAWALLLVLLGPIGSCSTESADQPGLCKLSCSKAIIAPSDYRVEKLTGDLNVRCGTGTKDASGNITATRSVLVNARFGVYKMQVVGDSTPRKVPVPNVSIYPVILGLVDETVGAAPFLGVVTDKSEFCTDSCGGVTLQIAAKCPEQESTDLTVDVSSGALSSAALKQSLTVTLKAPDAIPDDEAAKNSSSSSGSGSTTGISGDGG